MFSLPAVAQVEMVIIRKSDREVQRFMGKRAARDLSIWAVAVVNKGLEPLTVSEHRIVFEMAKHAKVNGTPYLTAFLVAQQAKQDNGWKRFGRIVKVAGLGAAQIGDVENAIGDSGKLLLSLFIANSDFLGNQIAGVAPPILENFLKIAGERTMEVAPGAGRTMMVFSEYVSPRPPEHFLVEDWHWQEPNDGGH